MVLTPAGRKLLAKSVPIWRATHADLDRLLGAQDIDRLGGDLRAVS
jgi:hypothetical protein